ncbi:hypothetical protein PGQ11_004588 [Apiospora arundinis]|uniref:Yippee/Mis18/Cereblon domain-containing protein n=1 Tax=Apiospora arundinis TaxID=335852 RepID=A0ABR2J8E5_9PEZI
MDLVILSCKTCEAALGTSVNAWLQIGKTYVSPILSLAQDLDVVASGSVRTGEPTTLVAQCDLQDVACRHCEVVIGLRCLTTPTNHVLQENQLMLRLTSISICAAGSDRHVQPNIKRTLKLKGPEQKRHTHDGYTWGFGDPYQGNPTAHTDTSASHSSWSTLRSDLDAQGEQIRMLGITGRQIVSTFDEAVTRIDRDIQSMKTDFNTIQEGLDNHGSAISRLTAGFSSLKNMVKENQKPVDGISDATALREQLSSAESSISAAREDFDNHLSSAREKSSREIVSVRGELARVQQSLQDLRKQLEDYKKQSQGRILTEKAYAEEVHLLQKEIAQLRDIIARGHARTHASYYCALSREEVDILIGSITKFGNRAAQVETIHMESQLLKGRVQRLETYMALAVGGGLGNDGNGNIDLENKSSFGFGEREDSRITSKVIPSKRLAPQDLSRPQ